MPARPASNADSSQTPSDASSHEDEQTPYSTAASPASNGDGGEDNTAARSSDPQRATLGTVQEPQRLHPLTLLQRLLASLPLLLILLFPVLSNPGAENLFSLILSVVYGLVAVPVILLRYFRFSYRISPKQIVIQKGVLNRQNRSIPIERVQNIQIEQNLLAQLVGIAKVKIETAGSSGTEGVLEFVGLDQAEAIRQAVRSFQREQRVADRSSDADAQDLAAEGSDDAEPTDDEPSPERAADVLFTMGIGRVLLSGAFRFSLLYIVIIFFPLQLADPDVVFRWVMASRGQWEDVATAAATHPALSALLTVMLAILLGWVSGVVLHLNQFYGFRLWLDGDKLRKRHGLLTVTEGTIPLKKVQALIVKTNPLMRVFGWYELEVQTVGLNVDEQGHRVLVPFAQRDALLAVAQQVRTFDVPTTFDAVSPLTIRRMSVRYTMVLAVAMAIALYFWPVDWWHPYGVAAPWWGGVLIPLLIGWAGLQYRYHGYAVRDDGLYIRRGVLTHHLWVLPTEKFHVFYTTASIFQRRLNLKTLFVDTAGAAAFAYPEVIDVPEAVADDCLERLQTQFRTLYRNRVEAATGSAETRLSADERPQLPSTVSVTDDAS